MSFQERRAIASLISTMLASTFYFREVFQRLPGGSLNTASDLSFWGAAVLIFVPVFIVFNIVIHVIFSIFNTVITKEEEPSITDELDRLVNLKSTRNFFHVFMVGFMLSMVVLAAGLPPYAMFIALLFSIMLAGMTLDISQFIYYRRGV